MTNTTPNMDLVLPDVIMTTGPGYAYLINAAQYLIDSHDHSPGKGVIITPAGINISSDLTINQNNLTTIRTTRFFNNTSFTYGANDKGILYELNGELWYTDASGNNVQITLSGALDLSGGLVALTIKDSNLIIENATDTTKQFKFNAANLTTATSYVFSLPASTGNDTWVLAAATQTLTNKTLTGNTAVNLVSGSGTVVLNTSGTFTLPNVTDTAVGLTATQTLTNKSLTAPAVTGITATGAGQLSTTNTFVDTSDSTKRIGFSTSGNTTNTVLTIASQQSNSETISVPNIAAADTFAVLGTNQIFTGTQVFTGLVSTTAGLNIRAATSLSFFNSTNTFATTFTAGANTSNYAVTLPITDGTNGQVLQTNGSGVWSFVTQTAGTQATATTLGVVKGGTVPGQISGSAVAAGYLGEQIISSASGTNAAASGSALNLASVALTAGIWQISAYLFQDANGATTTGISQIGLSTTSGSFAGLTLGLNEIRYMTPSATTTLNYSSCDIPSYIVSISSTTTYYFLASTVYSAGTPQYYGTITALRVG